MSRLALEASRKKKPDESIIAIPVPVYSEEKKMESERDKHKRKKPEEVFTDKDRAAVVTMGFKDIKLSLRQKKKQEKKEKLAVTFARGEDFFIGALLGQAKYQMRIKKQPEAALSALNKVLEFRPNHKEALVARSQCYLILGNSESALQDAERVWNTSDPTDPYIPGLYQYAEALYHSGHFEKALIIFHQGQRIRKDQDRFRIGIHKSEQAIKKAIGSSSATEIPNLNVVLSLIEEMKDVKRRISPEERCDVSDEQVLKYIISYRENWALSSPQDENLKKTLITKEFMGQLYLDKAYLRKFMQKPEVINHNQATYLQTEANEMLHYIDSREWFWRQEKPLYSREIFPSILNARVRKCSAIDDD